MSFIPKPKKNAEGGFPDFDTDFFSFLKSLIPDTIPTGWPRYRRGGSPRNWATPGVNEYVDPSGFVQIGSERREYDPAVSSGIEDFIFPTPFSGTPIVIATINETSHNHIMVHCHVYNVTKTQFTVEWVVSGSLYFIDLAWIAFGPGAG